MTTSRHAGPPVAVPPRGPAWPSRHAGPEATAGPVGAPVPAPVPPVPPEETLAGEPAGGDEVPPEERPLDPRAIARASLAAGRNTSLFWTVGGVAASLGATFVWGAVVGATALALLLVVLAVVRVVLPSPGPAGIGVRAKGLDVAMLLAAAVAVTALAWGAPTV